MIGGIKRRRFAFLGDAGIARRADEPRNQRARRDLPGERMLTAAGADEEDVHINRSDPFFGAPGLFRPRAEQVCATSLTDRQGCGQGPRNCCSFNEQRGKSFTHYHPSSAT
jgi:hypothetical protein